MFYARPSSLEEALAIRADRDVTVLAGGTDVYPAKAGRNGWGDMREEGILDITAVDELRGIDDSGDHVRLGALTTWTQLRRHSLPPAFAGIQSAAREVGGAQIQNRGTLAGNLCTASPAGDGIPCLLALDAEIELVSRRGTRRVPVADFVTGYRQTACAADELVTAILVPKPEPAARARFLKLGARRYLVISIVMASAVIAPDGHGVISNARIAIGACSAMAKRLPDLEAALRGCHVSEAAEIAAASHLQVLSPIDDIRASGAFRSHAALIVLRDLLGSLAPTEARAA
ncbi:N-methylhydantoinase B [Rhodoligotrophos appendicifer]|uniref:FAD binding domain-containing protein n=1 Tax=Rhodoligotrophos appendicifer TaxID=987056 RepID=UPI00118667BB|nr:FAD binding domain-containing protein [Rhodoligotrophos appendicifer]